MLDGAGVAIRSVRRISERAPEDPGPVDAAAEFHNLLDHFFRGFARAQTLAGGQRDYRIVRAFNVLNKIGIQNEWGTN